MQHIGYGLAFWEGDIMIAILWMRGQIRIRYALSGDLLSFLPSELSALYTNVVNKK
jgi:hypothetical protein